MLYYFYFLIPPILLLFFMTFRNQNVINYFQPFPPYSNRTCYDMCIQREPYNHSKQLYTKHGETIQSYLERTVLPAIRAEGASGGVPLLEELKFRWENHTIMNKWYSKFFAFLDRYHVNHHSLPSLSQVGLTAFKIHIYEHVKVGAKDAVIELIDKERDGEIIKKDLIKNTVKLYEAMGMGSLDAYKADLVSYFDFSSMELILMITVLYDI